MTQGRQQRLHKRFQGRGTLSLSATLHRRVQDLARNGRFKLTGESVYGFGVSDKYSSTRMILGFSRKWQKVIVSCQSDLGGVKPLLVYYLSATVLLHRALQLSIL